MKKVGFTAEEINDVKSALAAILYIGEFRFKSAGDDKSQVEDMEPVKIAAGEQGFFKIVPGCHEVDYSKIC